MKHPYEELGVPKNALIDDIKKAFRKKSKKTHPDAGGTNEKFDNTKKAYLILSDAKKRKQFDETGTIGEDEPKQHIHNEIASVFFGIVKQNESKIEYIDIIKEVLTVFERVIKETTNANIRLRDNIIKNEKLTLRFTKKDGSEDNIFLNFINAEINTLEASIVTNNELTDRMNTAISIVEIYKCEYKMRETQDDGWMEFGGRSHSKI
jgi:curved DNA-binding protein CbpA